MSLDPARREGLERARARAIARDSFSIDLEQASVTARPFGVVVADASTHVIVSSSESLAVLGGILIWMDREGLDKPHLVFEHHAEVQARRAALLAPAATVFGLVAGRVVPVEPAALTEPHPTPEGIGELEAMIQRCGADRVVEDGIVRAEVAGLEVGRIVTGPDGSQLEVGVGRFDREAGVLLHADRPIEPTLADTVRRISEHRRPGAPSDPVNRMARERWLRCLVVEDPAAIGVTQPELVEPIPPRLSLLEAVPAALLAEDVSAAGGPRVLVVCSVGVALELIPAAADLVVRHRPDHVRFVIPSRDRFPTVERLASRLGVPVSFAELAVPWVDGIPDG
jgi:hypothetical protein